MKPLAKKQMSELFRLDTMDNTGARKPRSLSYHVSEAVWNPERIFILCNAMFRAMP
jgi:hypothetical protein